VTPSERDEVRRRVVCARIRFIRARGALPPKVTVKTEGERVAVMLGNGGRSFTATEARAIAHALHAAADAAEET